MVFNISFQKIYGLNEMLMTFEWAYYVVEWMCKTRQFSYQ
jgi:hypothetical protein